MKRRNEATEFVPTIDVKECGNTVIDKNCI